MIKRLLAFFILLFMTIGGTWGQSLQANFLTLPSFNSSTQSISVCQGSTILFVLGDQNITNMTPSTTVQWSFTGANITSSTMRTPFGVTFTSNGTASLTLTDGSSVSTFSITVTASTAPTATPTLTCTAPSPITTTTSLDGITKFTYCPTPESGNFPFVFSLSSSLACPSVVSAASQVSLSVLGASATNATGCPVTQISRSFAQGFYYVIFRVQFANGCLYSKLYYVEVGKPTISLNTAASTACDPGDYSLSFNSQSPGVQYTIYWDYLNDPTIVNQYTHPNFPTFPQTVNHNYAFAPCVGTPPEAPSRQIKIKAVNACGETFPTAATIYVNKKPEAGFTSSSPEIICQGTNVVFTDTSFSGMFIENTNQCSPIHKREWFISPSIVAPNTISGTLGSYPNNINGSSTINITFNTPGSYSIGLVAFNGACEPDTIMKTICVVPAVQANFNASATTGCAPIAVTTTNNSSLPGCPGTNMLYNWSVSNATATCGTPAWNYTNNTNSNSAQPQFSFTGPGIYTIRLVSSLNPSVAGAQCQNDTITQTITVKGPPIIDLPPPSPICQGQAFIPQATVNDCYTTSSTYAWTFNSGTPASSTVLNPGSITYATSGNFTYSLSATNECGTDTENNTITVNQAAIVDASANSISCSGQAISLSGSVTGGATGGTWTSSAGGNFLPNSTTLNASFVPSPGATGSVTLTLTATGVVPPCPSVNDQVTISLNANPIVLAGNDTSICAGSTVLLQGSIGGAATSATWSTTGSGTFQSVSSLNTIYTPSAADISAGSVSLILTTNDPAGPCDPAKDTLNVVIIPIPTLTVGSSSAVCSGVAFSIPLTPSITSPPASYAWALSGSLPTGVTTTTSGTIAAPNSQFTGTVQNLSAGPVTLQYLLTATVNGCNSTSTPVSVVINPLPQPLITPPGPITACNGTSVTLTTSVFSSYLWSTNATTQSISVNAAGNYTVTVTNSYGCSGTSAATVVNFSVPLTPTFNQIAPICYNGTFSLPTTSINGISGTWSPTINPLATTTYTFTPSSGQCANTAQMTVTVNPLPIPTVTANGPLTFCQGSSVVLTATGGGTYIWNLNGAVIPNATSSSLTATQAGNYTVTVTNANGCSATSSVQVLTVNPLPQPTITASGAVNLCQGQSITLSTGTFDSYLWSSGQTSSSITVSTAGTYSVNVTSGGCTGTSNTIVVTINPVPAAAISGTATVCENGAQPNITFTGSNSTAPYTFTYSINGGANQTITTSATSSSVTLPVPTATTGTFTYTLSNVAVGACSSAVTAQAATITVSANIIPTFTQVGPYCNGASIPALPTTSNNSIVGSWAPAINNTATTAAITTNYTFTPTAGAGICATTATMAIVVNPNTIPLFTQLGPYCQGATPDVLPLTANNNIAGTWSPATISTTAAGSAVYTFTPSSSAPATCAVPTTMTIVVTTLPSAIISGTTTVCENGAQPNITFTGSNSTAPYTFTYSINGGANQTITTSATSSSVTLPVPTATTGTFTYTLSNVAVGACSSAVTAQAATITVSANIIPTFTQVGPYCNGASIPALPTTSNNSIVGSWAPAINNTATTAAVTTNYTFTPTAGAGICATTATMAIVVNPNTIPLFTQLGPYCQGATPDVLPLTANNNIAGTWSPATISTTAAGSAVYTFTPSSSAPATCAVPTTMTIVVTTLPSAIISGTTTVCENGAQPNITFTGSNSTAPYTFTYSINGGANQTITTSPTSSSVTLPVPTATTGTFTYTLSNVAVGACSSAVTAQAATITVSANIIPTFTQVGPYCNGASIPALPTTSNNSIVGSWAPAINNTASAAAVTTNYTFTPTAGAGICATTATMAIVVNPNTIPLFTQLGPYCQGATPDVLPLTANNNIAGTWSPATISTTAAGSAVYTFTPSSSAPATCAVPTTMTIVVTTLPSAIISGTTTVCENGAQPNITFTGSNSTAPYTFTYSINGGANQTITTSATSSSVTLPVPTATTGTFTYTLSNVAVGACSSAVTAQAATITVSANIIPTFTQVGPYCNGASIPALPTTSNNSIVGSWAPAINNTATTAAITTNYTFTPTAGAGICATTATMAIVVNPNTIPLFTQLGPYCQGATPDVLPLTANNNIAGTWSPATISTTAAGSAVYTFTPSSSAPATCAVPTTMTIVVTTLPSAIISGTTTVCENGAQPNITFTGSNSTAPYTFTYSINGGANQTITTSATSSSVTLPVPTATTGTFTYTLSNVAVGACSSAVTAQAATITVSANIIPTFTQVGPYCNGASIPALPTTSNNSIVGSWAPAINNTASAAAVTTNYTFTPTAGAGICATTATMAIVVNPNTIPLFTQLGPYCQGATPDVLPLTANNNIAGTWSPATISTTAAGSAVYTFTPSSSAPATCAVPTTMTIVVTTLPSAIISGTTTVCENGAQPNITFTGSNSTAPYTFTYSINGGANQTITTSATSSSVTLPVPTATTGTFTYTLSNVAVGACSSAVTAQAATITVSANIIPTFTQVGPYCNGASIPALPTTSNNSIVGSWAPAINNTATTAAITTNYTFTPTAGAGICATTATMAIVVNPNTIPLFTQLGPYCQGATPDVLPLTANNNIAGTWSPATISTTAAGSAVYTFTPSSSAPATCAVPTTMTIVVTTLPSAIISGTTTVCENGAQPNITFTGSNSTAPYTFTYSINGGANQTITTSATSSSVTLPVPTATTGTFTYTLSNVAVGACSSAVTAQAATITVSANIIPTFTQVGPYCNGASIPALPTTSNNSIVGSWAPAINNTASAAAVTTNYTFTPTAGAGICATTATMAIVVNPNTIPLFTQLGPYCQGATPDVLPLTANNNIAGTWSPATISTTAAGSAVYTFTPSSSAPATCAVPTTMTIVVTTLPSAIISGTTTVCENGAQPNITFTGSNSTAPYTFTYSINGGANQTITTSATSSSVTLPVPTATTGTFTYTLSNVAVGACSSAVTAQAATITVSANIIPTFTQVGPYCNGASIPALPTTSNNSIVGSWAPAINNTATTAAITTNYTFTPTAGAGICATTATMAIVVNPNTIPLFTQLGPYCQGATPDVLPLTANNNIAGTWSPATISTAGIIGAVSSTTYTFTPNIQDANAPQCALPGTMTILVTPLPGATISGDTTLCQGSNLPVVVFTGSNSAGPYTFTYNINGGANQTITTPANSSVVTLPVPTSVPGAFIYNLTGVSVGGCTNAITAQNVTVNVIQTPTVSLAASTTLICPNEPVVLTATGIPATFNNVQGSYTWSNTSTITSNIQTVNPVTVGPNNYTVTYTLNNCTSQPATVTISVQTAPQITIQNSPNATICEGGCVILSAVPSASTIIPSSYSWSTGETTQSITVCPTDTTTYTVIGLSGTCQSPLASTVVNVMPDPAFSTALIPDTSICVGGSFTFNVAVSGGVGTPTYNWYLNNQPNNFSGVLLPNSNNAAYSTPTIIQPTTQYYYVEVTYPGLGCDQIVSPVASLNVVADPIVTIDPLFNQTLCEGGTATCIVPEITGGVGTNTYLWIPTMSADSIFCPPSDQLGTLNYNVIVQQSGIGCGSLPSNTVSITVISDPTIQIVGLDAVCEGAEVPLITAVQGGLGTIANYQWSRSYPNGNPYQDIVGANAFNYTTVVLTDQIGIAVEMNQTVEGCNATDTLLINVYDDPQVSIIGDSMTCMGLDNLLQAVVSGGVPNSTNTFTWFSPGTELNPNPTIVQGAGLFNIFSGTIISDTSFFVTLDNSGFGCDNDTSAIFAIDAIEWAIANFEIDPEIPSQSILTPTFSFINSSQNATSYFWDLGECDPQLPMSELYTTPTLTYNPNSVDQMNYTYGCSPGYYSVTLYAYNQGMCPDTVTQIIRIRDEVIVYVPNAFTPGDLDNTNPTFYPVITGKIKPGTYRFSIFNRWGELIYETYEPTDQWDGRYYKTPIAQSGAISNDEFVQDGVYIWKLSFIAEETGDKIEKVGHVTKLKSDKDN